jgi:hypothetical protein
MRIMLKKQSDIFRQLQLFKEQQLSIITSKNLDVIYTVFLLKIVQYCMSFTLHRKCTGSV